MAKPNAKKRPPEGGLSPIAAPYLWGDRAGASLSSLEIQKAEPMRR